MRHKTDIRTLRVSPDILAASLATNLFALALPLTILHVFDRVIPNQGTATLAIFAAAVVLIAMADLVVRVARSHLISVAGFRFEVGAHLQALRRVLHAGADLALAGADDVSDRFASIGRMRRHYGSEMAMALLDVPFILLFLVVMSLISPLIGLAAAVLSLVSLVVVWLHRRRIIALNHDRQKRDRRRHSFLTESLEGIEAIKAMGIEATMQRRYERLMASSVPTTRDLSGLVNFTQGVTGTIALISPVVIAGFGSLLVMEEQMTMGGLAAAVLLTGRIIQPTLRIEALIAGERDIRPAVEDVRGLLEAPMRLEGTRPLGRVDSVALDSVTWTPQGRSEPILDRVNLTLRRGDCISIDGADGSGRSSLLSLIAGHTRPCYGEVSINGVALTDYDPQDLTERISYLSANQSMLEGTLLDNMTRFQRERHDEAAFALARELGLDEFISRHPRGYALNMAAWSAGSLPKSVHDSALIVTGLVGQPDVILFDEANLGLDHQADAALRHLLERLKPEVILVLVTYRPSLRALADRHYRIDNGALTEQPMHLSAAVEPPLRLSRRVDEPLRLVNPVGPAPVPA